MKTFLRTLTLLCLCVLSLSALSEESVSPSEVLVKPFGRTGSEQPLHHDAGVPAGTSERSRRHHSSDFPCPPRSFRPEQLPCGAVFRKPGRHQRCRSRPWLNRNISSHAEQRSSRFSDCRFRSASRPRQSGRQLFLSH